MKFDNFEQFWLFYLSEHRKPITRALHFVGTTLGAACLVAAIVYNGWFALAALFVGYGFAWIGHFFFEKNRPATFRHPLWSFRGDFRMYRVMMTGRIRAELEKAEQAFPPGK